MADDTIFWENIKVLLLSPNVALLQLQTHPTRYSAASLLNNCISTEVATGSQIQPYGRRGMRSNSSRTGQNE